MAGCSLTVMRLDDELEKYWKAPATPPPTRRAPRRGHRSPENAAPLPTDAATATPQLAELSDEQGRRGGRVIARAIDAMAEMLADAEEELGRIDAVAGDGDHGRGMVKG